jgi:hypothetical protein
MGLLRMGDPIGHPDTDIMRELGIRYELDSIWTSGFQARGREKQLELNGKVVYQLKRMATPEEAHQHLNTDEHKDGRYTEVFDVWVAAGRTYRKKQMTKPKLKMIGDNDRDYTKTWENWVGDDYVKSRRKLYQKPKTKRQIDNKKSMGDTLNKGIIDLTKAAVIGTMGIGLVGAIGSAVMRKKFTKRKNIKKCRCK